CVKGDTAAVYYGLDFW
nr:immunoglobulin heavy chain junction region [Macaca mulatta]MOX64070.1 immunoglobulin heavy chain junction region [Macaca mulatta]MOX64333.1 immunoglobulin heavy chain junction region [Macaca mulatta]MOX64761.1 immunoglobulin heavy chain junction region [Macaca mulatta]MOX66099.1 immunoglobulin heavy chain junction region [Macaca mulatta]